MKIIRLLLIEDNKLLREGILSILEPYKDIVANATSGDHKNTLLKIQQLESNLVLLDMGLRNQNSLDIVKMVKREFSKIKVVVMDLAPAQDDILNFIEAGANGFIFKDASLNDLIITIRKVANGATVIPTLLIDSLFSKIVGQSLREHRPKIKNALKMTKHERVVIRFLLDGITNKEISQQMQISIFTVKSNIHNIIEKLALHTRMENINSLFIERTV